ncbi:hypothetical protein SBY92_000747 [Candida maltosa Xu316]
MSDNTNTKSPATGDTKSESTMAPSSFDASTSNSAVNNPSSNVVDDKDNNTSDQNQQPQGSSFNQQFNSNYQGYNNNPGYNNYNNSNYYNNNKNQYHKNYNGNRQNNYNNPNQNSGNNNNNNNNNNSGNNQRYNNNKKQYNNQKVNHHHHHGHHNQQPSQQQFMTYPYGSPAPQMYGYYMGPGYQQMYVPGIPVQYGAIQATPGQQYAAPQMTSSQPQQVTTPPTPKIKLTTKDGKPVDLEEKKRKTASSTPVGSPLPKNVTPVSTAPASSKPTTEEKAKPDNATTPAATTTPSTTPASETKATGLSAAEEFKRKIMERAAAAAKEKAGKDAPKEEKKEEVAPKPVASPSETVSTTTDKPTIEKEEEPKVEEPEVKKEEQPKEEVITEEKVETKVEEKSEQPEEETVDTKEEEEEQEGDEEEEQPEQPETEETEEVEVEGEEGEGEEKSADSDSTSTSTVAAPEFTISQFLDRLKIATPIEDILATKYPENIQGVDASKQLPGKKYRYDPQFLIQFRNVVNYNIDPVFKAHLESMDIHPNGMKRSGSTRDGSYRGGLPGKLPGGIPARFNGPGGKGNSQYEGGRQNSRSGSKRGGRGGSSRDRSTRKGGNPSKRGGRGEMREKTEEELAKEAKPAEEVKPLEKSANRWVPKSRQQKKEVRTAEDGTIILEKEDIERKTNSLLNKLTLEMFTEISNEIIAITNQSKWEKEAETVKQIISLTFAKACDEPHWSEMYARLCAKMCTSISDEIKDESIVLKDGSVPSGGVLARRILLSTCQREYEKGWSDKLPTNPDGSPLEPEMMSDEYYAMAAAKRRGLGLVKFIGHLYNLNMLNDQVIFDQSKNTVDPSEDSLENLVQLIKTVGEKLDSNESTRSMIRFVFENVEKIINGIELSSRIKFMLMDLQDLRAAKWKSSKADAGPKTIEEIHRDAEIKKIEEERAKMEKKRKQNQYGNDSRSNSSRGGSSWNNNNNNNNSNNNNNNNNNNSQGSNTSFVKKSQSFVNQRTGSNRSPASIQSAPSSSDLQRESSKRSESTQINRFAMLGAGDDDDEEEQA